MGTFSTLFMVGILVQGIEATKRKDDVQMKVSDPVSVTTAEEVKEGANSALGNGKAPETDAPTKKLPYRIIASDLELTKFKEAVEKKYKSSGRSRTGRPNALIGPPCVERQVAYRGLHVNVIPNTISLLSCGGFCWESYECKYFSYFYPDPKTCNDGGKPEECQSTNYALKDNSLILKINKGDCIMVTDRVVSIPGDRYNQTHFHSSHSGCIRN